jgi:hypothetical protein
LCVAIVLDGKLQLPSRFLREAGTISGVDVKSENIQGEVATVVAGLHFKDGTSKPGDTTDLIKENGDWRIGK